MPGYSGLEVCERVKGSPASARMPVLLTVGKMEPFRPEDGMKVKADGVIIKPFEATDLVTVVDKLAQRCGLAAAATANAGAQTATVAPVIAPPITPPAEQPPITSHAAEVEADAPWEDESSEATLQQFTTNVDLGEVAEAAGLQTFTPASANDAIEVPAPAEFEPTSLPEESANTNVLDPSLMDDFGMVAQNAAPEAEVVAPGSGLASGFVDPSTWDGVAESTDPASLSTDETTDSEPDAGATEEGPSPRWQADEAEMSDFDAALDLEAEMQAAAVSQASVAVAIADPAPADLTEASDNDSDVFEADFGQTDVAPAGQETARPLLAPLGKTSFDELDELIARTAAKFDAAVEPVETPTANFGASVTPNAELRQEEVETSLRPAPGENFEPTAQADAAPAEVAADPELLSEGREEVSASTPWLHSADPLNDVPEMETPTVFASSELNDTSDMIDKFPDLIEPTEKMAVPAAEVQVDVEIAQDSTPAADQVENRDSTLPMEAAPAVVELIAAPHIEEAIGASTEPDIAEALPATPAPAAISSADCNAELVERVVERVVERIKPMLSIIVEEIVREFKQQ
jgi:CheY-like chemotaxis protein